MADVHAPDVDLVLTFRVSKKPPSSKKQTRDDARKAEQQYSRLIKTLNVAGLKAVGRRGESLGHILIFVTCPNPLVEELVKRERRSDFLSGLPVIPSSSVVHLSPADRIRLVHSYITSTPPDGGLGVSPDASEWDLLDSIFPLHDRDFNERWTKAWTPRNIFSVSLESIRGQFGDSLAFYFAFLSSYTKFLIAPAALGLIAHFILQPYAPIYSILLSIWSIGFVEWWRVHERILSLRFGTRGSFKVEKRRVQYKTGMAWWAKELRVLANVPVILLFAGILSALLTGIFVFEAFVTHLYQGPGKQIIAFSPTLLFVALVPQILGVYQKIAVRLTNWENHGHQSSYATSLTLKTFILSTLVAYLGLGLSAFVYVPFGEGVMRWVQAWLFGTATTQQGFSATISDMLNGTVTASATKETSPAADSLLGAEHPQMAIWDANTEDVRNKLNPKRLRDQMFAYTVTNQIINTFIEVGLPFILRHVDTYRKNKAAQSGGKAKDAVPSSNSSDTGSNGMKKRVVFEDEKEKGGMEERLFLDRVRQEAALPAYDTFVDYNEMVVQFGYVVLWSTIWPLAGVMALLNNILELRSDAFKMTVHNRRPIPTRTDTVGPWLEALTFLTWLGALTNSALVYLFCPSFLPSPSAIASAVFNATTTAASILIPDHVDDVSSDSETLVEEHLVSAAGGVPAPTWGIDGSTSSATLSATKELLLKAILVALVASHGFILLRLLIRHIVERVFYRGSTEVEEREREEKEVKVKFLRGTGVSFAGEGVEVDRDPSGDGDDDRTDVMGFWDHDEGIEEIHRISKET
ncbi:calcium-activated chloride channel-domain-containing protein [Panaeolus papilionaceus]|nr:calcium-activated chloride channel-domain-containing protein [Panaeolus papilionaceus]